MQSEFIVAEIKLALHQVHQQLMADSQYAAEISQRLLPYANELLKETRKGYQDGRYSVIQWVDAQTELFRLEKKLIDIQTAIYYQLLELERMTGQSLTKAKFDNTTHKSGIANHE